MLGDPLSQDRAGIRHVVDQRQHFLNNVAVMPQAGHFDLVLQTEMFTCDLGVFRPECRALGAVPKITLCFQELFRVAGGPVVEHLR